MRSILILYATCATFACSPASAQTIGEVQNELSGVLGDIEMNLVEKEAIEKNFKDWETRSAQLQARIVDVTQRMKEATAYCNGTFPEPEFTKRKTYCDATIPQLTTLSDQLQPDIANVRSEGDRLQQRETARAAAGDAIVARFHPALARLTTLCGQMSHDEFVASCHLPPAPGPRTAAMVAETNADLQGNAPQ